MGIKNKMNNKTILNLNIKIFFIFMFLISFHGFKNIRIIDSIGFIAIIQIFIISIIYFIRNFNNIIVTKVLISYFFILTYNILLLLRNINASSIYNFLMQSIILFLVTMLSSISINQEIIYKFAKKFKFVFFYFISIFLVYKSLGNERSILWLLSIAFATLYYLMLISNRMILPVILGSIIFFIAKERTLSIVIIIIYILYHFLNILKGRKKLYILFFFIVAIMLLAFPYLYVWLSTSKYAIELNMFISEYTGKSLFSGRQVIWKIVIDNIKNSFLFGYGFGNNILSENGIEISSHNLYLFLMLQGGVISILLFLTFMYQLWMKLYKNLLSKQAVGFL